MKIDFLGNMTRRAYLRLLALPAAAAARLQAFENPRPGYRYSFPRDHFDHPSFRTEWWYFTGNLFTAQRRRFGFELTFFRVGVERETPPASPWDFDQLYLAHLALSDIEAGRFYRAERLHRAGPGLAGVSEAQARIWNGNWSVEWPSESDVSKTLLLQAVAEEFSAALRLNPLKPQVIHGQNGVMTKSDDGENASHYVSLPRLAAEGTLRLGGELFDVTGTAWMDHEFFSQEMGEGQVGWDWMSIQLDNETELMLYRIRASEGEGRDFLAGTYVDPAGRSRHLKASDIAFRPGKTWTSKETGAHYPIEWTIEIPSLAMNLDCRTPLASQEIVTERGIGPNYWEGAVDYRGSAAGRSVAGVGYLEMTGYDKPVTLNPQRAAP